MKFVIFRIADLEFGMEIAHIQEIIRPVAITPLPQSPAYIEGVINLRGNIIPVMNLSRKLGLHQDHPDAPRERFIISSSDGDRQGSPRVAFRVHAVFQVVDIDPSEMEPPPSSFINLPERALLGVGKLAERIVFLLVLHELLTMDEKLYLQRV